MKTAVLISGQIRTFGYCLPNLNWEVFRRLENPTFFVSCADDDQGSAAYLLEGYSENVHIQRVAQPKVEDLKHYPFSLARHAPYAPTPNNPTVIPSILRQLWHYNRVWDFMHESSTDKFDVVVRCRPDLFFHRFDMPEPLAIGPRDFFGPWKATCGGVNDRFSIMGIHAAEAYFTAYNHLDAFLKAGCPLHPESIQQAALEAKGVRISNTLQAEFMVMRLQGQGDHVPLVEYPGEMARFVEAIHKKHAPFRPAWDFEPHPGAGGGYNAGYNAGGGGGGTGQIPVAGGNGLPVF